VVKKDAVKKKIADLFDLPPDVIMDLPRITLIGSLQLYVENHKGITLYEKEKIIILVQGGALTVEGTELQLKTVYTDDIYIEGTIRNLSLEERK